MPRFRRAVLALFSGVLPSLIALPALAQTPLDPHQLFAAEKLAAGGDAWTPVAALEEAGTSVSGGGPTTFDAIVARASGYSRTAADSGPLHDVSGFDGFPWDSQNGSSVTIDLPGLVADAVTQAYVSRDGWWQANGATMTYDGEKTDGALDADVVTVLPDGGSGIDVWIDRRTHLIARTVAHADAGDVVTNEDDYRVVDGTKFSFHSISIDATGAKTETTLKSVSLQPNFDLASIARPVPEHLSSFAGPAPAVVPFEFSARDAGQLIIPATFAKTIVHVYFDSGGAAILTPEAGKRLALASGGGTEISGVGSSSVAASFANIGTLGVGDAQLAGQTAIILPLPFLVSHPRANLDVDGLVGAELLKNFKTTVDYAAKTISFAPFDVAAVRAPFTVPLYTDGSQPYVYATIDGVSGLFGIDTGDGGGLSVFRRFASAHDLYRGHGEPFVSAGGVGGTVPGARYRGTSLTIAGTTLRAPIVSVTETTSGAFASRSIAGNIGARILGRFKLTFDYAHHLISFQPNSHVKDRFAGGRSGLSLTQTSPNYLTTLYVVPGSPAAQAGMRTGDKIVAVTGIKVSLSTFGADDLVWLTQDLRLSNISLRIERAATERNVVIRLRELE